MLVHSGSKKDTFAQGKQGLNSKLEMSVQHIYNNVQHISDVDSDPTENIVINHYTATMNDTSDRLSKYGNGGVVPQRFLTMVNGQELTLEKRI